jgi:CRISPR-associated endonuclease/helicase Cas3
VAGGVRDGDPEVSVVLLSGEPNRLWALADPGLALDLEEQPSLPVLRALMDSRVRLGGRFYKSLASTKPPRGWQRSAWLRDHRALVLDGDGEVQVGDRRLAYDEFLGVTER